MKINSEVKMIVGIVVICVVLLGAFIWFAPKPNDGKARDLSLLVRPNSHMTGTTTAKVTLVEFGDFQCPACATVSPFVKQIADSYKTNPNFNFVYRNFPLSQHINAFPSAEAAEAANAQGKYWEMSELLYKNQNDWAEIKDPTALFVSYAKTVGLDIVKFKADIDQKKFADFIQADLNDAKALALDYTPFLLLNGVEVTDLQTLKAQIDAALTQ
jgi:protein-disulfide isomerase